MNQIAVSHAMTIAQKASHYLGTSSLYYDTVYNVCLNWKLTDLTHILHEHQFF